jgi:hypothetical protein
MQPECFDLAAYKHPFKNNGALLGPMPEGVTIAEIVRDAEIDPRFLMDVQVTVSRGLNSSVVPMSAWHKVRPRAGAHVLVTPRVRGPAAAVLLGALLPHAAGYVAGTVFGLASGTLAYALTYAAITIVGSLLINALIPPPSTPAAAKQDDPNFSITGSANAENRYGVFPTVLGRHFMYPPKTARGYTEGEGDNIHFRGRYTFGYGPVVLETLKIGTTPITEFEGVEIEFLNVDEARTLEHMPELAPLVTAWRTGDAALSLYPDDIAEDAYSVKLAQGTSVVRATRDRCVSVSVDVTYQGLVKFDGSNNKQSHSVQVRYRYRKFGAADWVDAGTVSHTGRSTASLRFTKTIALPDEGEYDIEVTRLSADSDDTTVRDDAFLSAIRSVQAGSLPSHSDIAEIAVRIKASDQLNGQIETLNAVVHQTAPVWDGAAWSAPQPVRHPAWIYARALMGPMLSKPVETLRIQLDDLRDWADQEPHWTCDAVIDQSTTVAEVLDLICATGRARRTLRDLKYSVIRDGGAGPIVQQFSPRNSWGFTGSIQFPKAIHGFRVRCLSERLEWQQDEIIVYADGHDTTTATEFETLELRGVVLAKNEATGGNAWRLGRYHLAQAILRPEEFSWQCDLEHLRVNMGDKVRLIHDVPLIGVGYGRVRQQNAFPDGTLSSFVLDEALSLAGVEYRVCWRQSDGSETVFRASPPESLAGQWLVIAGQDVDAAALRVGDLVGIEEMTVESMEVLVRSITHQGDLKATLTGVPAAPAVLTADQGEIPEYSPNITKVVPRETLLPAGPVIQSSIVEVLADPARVVVSVEVLKEDQFNIVSYLGVLVRADTGEEVGRETFTSPSFSMTLPSAGQFLLKVRSVDKAGKLSAATVEAVAREVLETVPKNVSSFQIRILGDQAHLSWSVQGVSVSHYHIRYLPPDDERGWDEATDIERDVDGANVTVPALPGRYLIKAVSIFREYSPQASEILSTISFLEGYNVVREVALHPAFTGTLDVGLARVAGGVQFTLDAGETSGTAVFTSDVTDDLGAALTSRVTANLDGFGVDAGELWNDWGTWDEVESWAGSVDGQWRIQLQISTTVDDPDDVATTWSEWSDFLISDYLARAFKFRVIFTSHSPDVQVLIRGLSIKIDVPDRIVSGDDIACPAAGMFVPFAPPFLARPAVAVDGQGLPSGAESVRTQHDANGFHQRFLDASGNGVACTFDYIAKGYGRLE